MRISDNQRYILDDHGNPFFYMADTTWRFFYDTTHEMAERYMQKRKEQGFTLFMPVLLSEVNPDENDENQFGQLALIDWDPTRPNERFFEYVDWTIRRAREIGLIVGILPTWGEFVGPIRAAKGPVCFNVENAFAYGEFLGKRYRDDPNIIWIVGGDRVPSEEAHVKDRSLLDDPGYNPISERYVEIWRSMANGLRKGDEGRHLITFHPAPVPELDQFSCSYWLPNEPWLDFYMLQTGTKIDRPNYLYIRRDYEKTGDQRKPTLDGECRYEYSHEHFNQFPQANPSWGRRISAHQVRKAMYNAMLSGAAGHTYGCRCVWNFYHEGTLKTRDTDLDWRKALDLPGAWQVRHMRALLERYPFYRLIPDFADRVVVYGQGADGTYMPAAVSEDGDFALVYVPEPQPFKVDLGVLSGPAKLKWYDVRDGSYRTICEEGLTGVQTIYPIEEGEPDYVLVMETIKA